MLACPCLNVTIEMDQLSADLTSSDAEEIGLQPYKAQHSFFQQDLKRVLKLRNISKVHSFLVDMLPIGNWILHYCINCDMYTHAVHTEKGAACVLISPHLLDDDAIKDARKGPHFSKLFNILVRNSSDLDDQDGMLLLPTKHAANETEPRIQDIKQIASDALRNETMAIEEEIKRFTEDAYSRLENIREQVFKEQRALIKIILNHNSNDSTTMTTTTTSNYGMDLSLDNDSEQIASHNRLSQSLKNSSDQYGPSSQQPTIQQPQKDVRKWQNSKSVRMERPNADSLLFDFELEEQVSDAELYGPSEEDDDNDLLAYDGRNMDSNNHTLDNGSAARLVRGRTGMTPVPTSRVKSDGYRNVREGFAQSLPMNIPSFIGNRHPKMDRRSRQDLDGSDDESYLPTNENVDIAASIKALAKSVHGDAVFGELPKPRFSRQI